MGPSWLARDFTFTLPVNPRRLESSSIYRCDNRDGTISSAIQTYNTNLTDHSPLGLFTANETQSKTRKKRTTTTTIVKNPKWPEANQLAIYKCIWEVGPGTTRFKFNERSERVLNPGFQDLKASALTTRPHSLLSPPPPPVPVPVSWFPWNPSPSVG